MPTTVKQTSTKRAQSSKKKFSVRKFFLTFILPILILGFAITKLPEVLDYIGKNESTQYLSDRITIRELKNLKAMEISEIPKIIIEDSLTIKKVATQEDDAQKLHKVLHVPGALNNDMSLLAWAIMALDHIEDQETRQKVFEKICKVVPSLKVCQNAIIKEKRNLELDRDEIVEELDIVVRTYNVIKSRPFQFNRISHILDFIKTCKMDGKDWRKQIMLARNSGIKTVTDLEKALRAAGHGQEIDWEIDQYPTNKVELQL